MINIAKIEEYYLFNTVLKKILNIWSTKGKKDKMLTSNVEIYCQMKFPFFKKYSAIFRFVICVIQSDRFLEPKFNFYANASLCCVIIFISVLVIIFFNILPDFSANIFFSTLSRLQTIYFIFSDSVNNFFLIFIKPPSRKITVRPLIFLLVREKNISPFSISLSG